MTGGFVTAILLAGGSGKRIGGVPKQFLDVGGRPMLVHSLLALEATARVSAVVVVLPEVSPPFVGEAIALPKVRSVAIGGSTRQASLGEGLICIPDETAVVLVQDAARPLLTPGLVDRVLDGFDGSCEGVVCAIPVDDALKSVSLADQTVLESRSRSSLWRAQTPQAFLRACLEDSLARADARGLASEDCSEMAVRAGYKVRVVRGDRGNLKVTEQEDLRLCEALLAGPRPGSGTSGHISDEPGMDARAAFRSASPAPATHRLR